jgi:serine/threonine-protein kinase
MTDPVAALREGLRDRYAFERELGRGGMATVWLARDLRHDRPVALKVLHPELAASLGPERFQREIRVAARLQHPHVLTVLDSGAVGERLWFTMPYVQGESLRDRLRRERQLPLDDALRIAREAAQALQYAHEQGVIHRDIKPENMLLTRDGNTLVADFGIARALGTAGDERLTETGLAVGTPAYMSPEQAAGDRGLDARTDVYSLAAVLYEMLAGEPPYTGATTQALIAKRLTEPPPSVRSMRPNVAEAVDLAIRKALSPVPADRFAGMAQFGAALTAADGRSGGQAVGGPATLAVPSTGPKDRPAARPPVRLPVAATALVLGILIGLGVLFAWRRTQGGGTAGSRVLAVLPFENLGDSANAYFADGITDEVRTKLAKVTGLYVIARGSSNEYRGSDKRAQEIARELGAGYLLTGTVRWTKAADGSSRVRVAPELVEVQTGQPPRTRWGEQFDAGITDVFQVQADIAGKVVSALDVALADSVRSELTARPTESVAAYDAFLKAEATFAAASDMRRAISWYQEAVRLDPDFALAWARLAQAVAIYSGLGATPEMTALGRRAVERARSLAPDDPATYAARVFAESFGGTTQRALEIAEEGLRVAPNNAELLGAASLQEMRLGRFENVVALAKRALTVDPRAGPLHRRLGYAFMVLGSYPEAHAALERALAVAPGSVSAQQSLVLLGLMQGDIEPARRIAAEPNGVTGDQMLAYLAQFEELFWALDDRQQQRILELGPELFDDSRSAWALAKAHVLWTRGDRARARVWADTARIEFGLHLRATPDDPQPLMAHGAALAYLGHKAQAMQEGKRAVEVLPASKDMYIGPYIQHQLVRIYLAVGENELALDALEPLLKMPYSLTPAWLRIDPMFEPIRNHPRFRKLVEGKS